MFELNNRFIFHRIEAVDMLEFLKFIHNFLDTSNTIRLSVNVFPIVSIRVTM